MDCADLAKHEIRVIDDEPFKERFQRIPPPMVDEVSCTHEGNVGSWVLSTQVRAHGVMQLC